jgi:hypothetical protein
MKTLLTSILLLTLATAGFAEESKVYEESKYYTNKELLEIVSPIIAENLEAIRNHTDKDTFINIEMFLGKADNDVAELILCYLVYYPNSLNRMMSYLDRVRPNYWLYAEMIESARSIDIKEVFQDEYRQALKYESDGDLRRANDRMFMLQYVYPDLPGLKESYSRVNKAFRKSLKSY